MPIVTELPLVSANLSHWFAADYLATRSPGPHVKVIIDDLVAYHGLSTRKQNADFADSLDVFASLGFGWEWAASAAIRESAVAGVDLESAPPAAVRRIYEHAFTQALNSGWRNSHPREIVKPGETTYRGVHCTSDGVNVWGRPPHIEEWKATWTSVRGGLAAHPDWEMQVAAYCLAYGLNVGVVRGFFVNGAYEKGQMGKPVIACWRLEFSDAELEENWEMIDRHKQVMIDEGRLPPDTGIDNEWTDAELDWDLPSKREDR